MKQVAETSRAIYYSVVQPLVQDPQSRLILDTMRQKPNWTNKELSQELDIDASTVAARINRLKKLGEVVECGKRNCFVTGQLVKIVKLKTLEPQQLRLL